MEKVQELINEIHGSISQKSVSKKDEIRVMRSMLNDDTYKVDVYDKTGKVGEYCPAESARSLVASVLQNTTHITNAEATAIAKTYEFSKGDAENVVDISKEFINTYLHSGRKFAIGGREKSDVSMILKEVESGSRPYPKVVGTDAKGNKIYGRGISNVGTYESFKVISPCPAWIKDNK